MEVRLPGPESNGPYITSGAAGAWLWGPPDSDRTWGDAFDNLVDRHAGAWMRPIYLGREKRWRVEDVAVLAYLLPHLDTGPPARSKTDKSEEK